MMNWNPPNSVRFNFKINHKIRLECFGCVIKSFFIKQRKKKAINAMLSKMSYTNSGIRRNPFMSYFSPLEKVFSFTSQLALFSKILIHVPDRYRIGSQKSLFFFSTFISEHFFPPLQWLHRDHLLTQSHLQRFPRHSRHTIKNRISIDFVEKFQWLVFQLI